MPWSDVIGQPKAVSLLRRSIESERVGGSWLIHGPAGVGQARVALEFARALLCTEAGADSCGVCHTCRQAEHGTYVDIINLRHDPESKSGDITIDQVREIIELAYAMPAEARYRVFVIHEAERLNPQAADCLLKTLEEPSPTSVFILYTSNAESLPATIPSRCCKVRLNLQPLDVIEAYLRDTRELQPPQARILAQMSGGRLDQALALLDSEFGKRIPTALEALRVAVAGDVIKSVQNAQSFGTERPEARVWVRLLTSLLRDALLLRCDAGREMLTHAGNADDLLSIFSATSPRDIIRYIEAAQETDAMLEGNVHGAAAFEGLFFAMA